MAPDPHETAKAAVSAALVAFADLLRERDVQVSLAQLQTAASALAVVDPSDRTDAYCALRCTLLTDHARERDFAEAFAAFWDGLIPLDTPAASSDAEPQPDRPEDGPSGDEMRAALGGADAAGEEPHAEREPGTVGIRFSREERLRSLDFRDYSPEDLARASQLIRELGRLLPLRLSRRLERARHGDAIDRRATLHLAMRTEGHPLRLARRRRRLAPRRLVFVIDVSGSMEPYARPLFMFAQAACRASRRVEVFAFGTRLTRLTHELTGPEPGEALVRAGAAIPDWAGGTRIGDNLERLNSEWGSRGITRGAVVVIFSDGWERGGVETLREQMRRLHRAAHTLVWANPLAGDPDYEPLAAGMAAALQEVDVFLPVHNVRSLETLAAVIAEVGTPGNRRSVHLRRARAAGKPAPRWGLTRDPKEPPPSGSDHRIRYDETGSRLGRYA